MNNKYIRTGDIVLVKDYPNPQHEEANSQSTKDRFAVVIGNYRDGFTSLPAQAIATKGGKTEKPLYRIRENELRIPGGVVNGKKNFELSGVIKAHRFPLIRQDQILYKAASLPLETKLHLVQLQEQLKTQPRHVNEMKEENPNYEKVIAYFKEVTVAEKLNFMRDDKGNHQYEFLRNQTFSIKSIQFLEKKKNLNIVSVKLEGDNKEFTHTFATKKTMGQVRFDWKIPKKAKDWIREDIKFHALQRNPLVRLNPDRIPHPDKYTKLEDFKEPKNNLDQKDLNLEL